MQFFVSLFILGEEWLVFMVSYTFPTINLWFSFCKINKESWCGRKIKNQRTWFGATCRTTVKRHLLASDTQWRCVWLSCWDGTARSHPEGYSHIIPRCFYIRKQCVNSEMVSRGSWWKGLLGTSNILSFGLTAAFRRVRDGWSFRHLSSIICSLIGTKCRFKTMIQCNNEKSPRLDY